MLIGLESQRVAVVTYQNPDGEYKLFGVWQNVRAARIVMEKRLRKLKANTRYHTISLRNKIVFIVFEWNIDNDGEDPPTRHDAELAEIERYTICYTRVKKVS